MSRPINDDSRVHYRIPVYYPAVMVHNGYANVGLITNLSIQGCAVEEEYSAPLGSDVGLHMQCLTGPNIALTAVVRWRQGHRCGLEFVGGSSHTYEQLRRVFIDALARRLHSAEGNA